jgi:hypothetical protein
MDDLLRLISTPIIQKETLPIDTFDAFMTALSHRDWAVRFGAARLVSDFPELVFQLGDLERFVFLEHS